MHLAALVIYPLKGARGIALGASRVLSGGLEHDRRFMLVDEEGGFVSQRRHPRMALVRVLVNGDALAISVKKGQSVQVPLSPPPRGPSRTVRVWRDDVTATVVEGDAAEMLSDHLGARVTLVHMPDEVIRPVDPRYAQPSDRVGFADAFPVLVATLASLDDLNARLAEPVTMDRFRPSIVLAGAEPYAEERHARLRVGSLTAGVTFRMPKRCARCEVTTIDQATATRGKEPLRTLADYRRDDNAVHFAMNAIPDMEGTITVGDPAVFLEPQT